MHAECLDIFSAELNVHQPYNITIPLPETENQGMCDPRCTLCYMISPLVCLSRTRILTEYFIGK